MVKCRIFENTSAFYLSVLYTGINHFAALSLDHQQKFQENDTSK